MESFLQLVARDLYALSGGDLSRTAVVFPGKRAALFLNPHLAREAGGRPLWAPTYTSISELMAQLSPLQTGDTLQLVCELYQVYRQETGTDEPLDDFYFWGELLVADFDDIDKNLVDADQLFTNLHDLKVISERGGSFLDEEQEAAIRHFFQDFSIERQTVLRERFLTLWEKMGSIYHRYRQRLRQLGIAYEGMMYRDALDNLNLDALPYERFAFVGFNVLSRVEHKLFSQLQQAGRAIFYWDYDAGYVNPDQPDDAGRFMRNNLKDFPNRLPAEHFHHLDQPKQVTYISAPTENAQARYVAQWTRQLLASEGSNALEQPTETAIVLCNENLLLPVLHALPTEVRDINITMGFPLIQTMAYSLLQTLLTLQTDGYQASTGRYRLEAVTATLRHPYLQRLSPVADELRTKLEREAVFFPTPADLAVDNVLAQVFSPATDTLLLCTYLTNILTLAAYTHRAEKDDNLHDELQTDSAETIAGTNATNALGMDAIDMDLSMSTVTKQPASIPPTDPLMALEREAVFMAYTLVGRLVNLLSSQHIDIGISTLRRLLSRLLDAARVPFHGEPAVGVQVMGVLETRNLDFRHVLMLSAGEGNLPRTGTESSFIPYNLRKAFHLTTIDHRNAVYAYHFYRLMQRAEQVTLTYNSSANGMNRGEMSRFMLQYLVQAPQPVERRFLQSGHLPEHLIPITIEKTPRMVNRLRLAYDIDLHPNAFFSPSSLNTYLDCQLKFYLRYIARLKPQDRVTADVDSAMFGTLFHSAAELTYRRLMEHGPIIRAIDIMQLLKDPVAIQNIVDAAFREKLFKMAKDRLLNYTGTQLVIARVIATYLSQLLQADLRLAPIRMESPEQAVKDVIEISTDFGPIRVQVGGIIDRMDIITDPKTNQRTRRIIDYKTGGNEQKADSIEQIFTPDKKRPGRIFQTFLYADIVSRQHTDLPVSPCLLLIHKSAAKDYSPVIMMGPPRQKMPVDNFLPYRQEFRKRLQTLLEEIFQPGLFITPCADPDHCKYCDYISICRRKN